MLEVIANVKVPLLRFGLVFVLTINLTACAILNNKIGAALNFETDLKLSFKVDSNINQDENSNPSPLFIRLYELNSPKMFGKADFINLYDRDKDVLSTEMINKQVLKRLKPGEDSKIKLVLNKETKYVGLYAEFLDFKDSEYKTVFPVVANNVIRTSVKVYISENKIKLIE